MARQKIKRDELVLALSKVDRSMLASVGGKAANLGDMIQSKRSSSLPVPPGFVLTSESYREFLKSAIVHSNGKLQPLFDQVGALAEDRKDSDDDLLTQVRRIGARIRSLMEDAPIPSKVHDAITSAWKNLEEEHHGIRDAPLAVAVRSSATAEDLPSSSFAGQQDTYLNIMGMDAVVRHIRLCWASLFTDRAIVYRVKNKFEHLNVYLCVVVQKQIDPVSSGIMFTADAISGKRTNTVIEAGFGLGEALVSGLINADQYKFDRTNGTMIETIIGDQHIEIVPTYNTTDGVGGTETIELADDRRKTQKLDLAQIHELLKIGQDIQKHYEGIPQDIEWCFERHTNKLYVVQSRPITTLFPLPKLKQSDIINLDPDSSLRVYVSIGHLQVMTDPIRPCGRSVFQKMLSTGVGSSGDTTSIMTEAGCYMFFDMTKVLQVPLLRRTILRGLNNASESMALSVQGVVQRDEFQASKPANGGLGVVMTLVTFIIPIALRVMWNLFFALNLEGTSGHATALTDSHVRKFRRRLNASRSVQTKLTEVKHELASLLSALFKIGPYALAGIASFGMIRKMLPAGEEKKEKDLDALRKGLVGNVTIEMDLVIGDLADTARQDPDVIVWLQKGGNLTYDGLRSFQGSRFHAQFFEFIDTYGCRANSEIDISRPRWRDDPSSILNVIRGNLTNTEIGHHRLHHQTIQKEGEEAAARILDNAPWYSKPLLGRLLRVARTLGALREHHKFLLIQVLSEVRLVVLEAAAELKVRGALGSIDDIWFLTIDEIFESYRWGNDRVLSLVRERREEFSVQEKLKPPHVLTSDGECLNVQPNSGYVPPGALGGLAVSSGVVEGIARVVTDPMCATLHSGEILVAPFTDPGWTPLFINASGLVMEIGGYLTHGSVVSREYGIPAVSCIQDATTKLETGMRLRVDGSRGFVEILSNDDATTPVTK
jgi:phosphohistidine swiveling domain-containing protein